MSVIKSLLGAFLCFSFGFLQAQISYSVSTDSIVAIKPSSSFVFYNYTEFENNTNDTLQMRWIKTETICSLPGEPGGIWDIGIQDHINFYNPANFLDSAEFYIPPVTGSTDKFLLHLFPNNQAGNLVVKFLIFPIDHPTDTVTLTFDYTATAITGLAEISSDLQFMVHPNPAMDFFSIRNLSNERTQTSLFSSGGNLIRTFMLNPKEEREISALELKPDIYFIKTKNSKSTGIKKIIISSNLN